MTESNPFSGAGFDMSALLQQAQAMQQQMVAAQEELATREIDGTVADGLVTATVNGAGELVRVKIRANSFDPADTEDLEDLIVAAYRDARSRTDELAAEAMSPLTEVLGGGLGSLGALGGGAPDEEPGSDAGRIGF
jgi:hypothetical protein